MARAHACDIIIDTKPTFGHCGIVTGNFVSRNTESFANGTMPPGNEVLHATSTGVIEGLWGNGLSFCFRSNHLTRTAGADIQAAAQEMKLATTSYGASRAIFKSWSGTSKFGKGALARLQKYQTRMQSHQGVLKNVFCSELVVVAYQLGLHLDQTHNAWIDLDGKHTLPSTLKTWMASHATNWTCMGTVTDQSLELTPV